MCLESVFYCPAWRSFSLWGSEMIAFEILVVRAGGERLLKNPRRFTSMYDIVSYMEIISMLEKMSCCQWP